MESKYEIFDDGEDRGFRIKDGEDGIIRAVRIYPGSFYVRTMGSTFKPVYVRDKRFNPKPLHRCTDEDLEMLEKERGYPMEELLELRDLARMHPELAEPRISHEKPRLPCAGIYQRLYERPGRIFNE